MARSEYGRNAGRVKRNGLSDFWSQDWQRAARNLLNISAANLARSMRTAALPPMIYAATQSAVVLPLPLP